MTQELSLIELILDASILVQIVMLILVLASVTFAALPTPPRRERGGGPL